MKTDEQESVKKFLGESKSILVKKPGQKAAANVAEDDNATKITSASKQTTDDPEELTEKQKKMHEMMHQVMTHLNENTLHDVVAQVRKASEAGKQRGAVVVIRRLLHGITMVLKHHKVSDSHLATLESARTELKELLEQDEKLRS